MTSTIAAMISLINVLEDIEHGRIRATADDLEYLHDALRTVTELGDQEND